MDIRDKVFQLILNLNPTYLEGSIAMSRKGFDVLSRNDKFIIFDVRDTKQIGVGREFDSVAEIETLSTKWQSLISIDFYGDDVATDIHYFANMLRSDLSKTICKAQNITVKNLANIQQLDFQIKESHHSERYSGQFYVVYNSFINIDLQRIEKLNIGVTKNE